MSRRSRSARAFETPSCRTRSSAPRQRSVRAHSCSDIEVVILCNTRYISGYNAQEVVYWFGEAVTNFSTIPEKFAEYVVLMVIKAATDPFYRNGYIPELADSLLEIMLENQRPDDPNWFKRKDFFKDETAFEFEPQQAKALMTRLFDRLSEVRNQSTQSGRILCSLTLVRLLGQFNNRTVVKSEIKKGRWLLNMVLDGVWFGWMMKRPKFFTEKQSDLVIVLCELLVYNRLEENSNTTWESNGEIYVYGTDISEGTKALPKTYITIKVQATKNICCLFQQCFETSAGRFSWLRKIPRDQFKMSINIECPKAESLGCSNVLALCTYPQIEKGIVESTKI